MPNPVLRSALVLALASSSPAQSVTQAPPRGAAGGAEVGPVELRVVSNGFGKLLPHEVLALDRQGSPTGPVLEIRSLDTLTSNVTAANPVRPVTSWPSAPLLPNGDAGNHYVVLELTRAFDVDSVLDDSSSGAASSGLLGTVTVTAVHPSTGQTVPISGRAFVGGATYAGTPTGTPPTFPLQTWVTLQGGVPVADPSIDNDGNGIPDGLGFPGTQSSNLAEAQRLLGPRSLVFVPDSDGDLSTHETFPSGWQIRLRASGGVRALDGGALEHDVLASTTVGVDQTSPEVTLGPGGPATVPSNGDVDVDPRTQVTIAFSEPLQPLSVGPLPGSPPAGLSSSIVVSFGPSQSTTVVPFTALPASVYDFSRWVLTPAYAFPGSGPGGPCGGFDQIDVQVLPSGITDLQNVSNILPVAFAFVTGDGPGIVNAPVAPDVIYVSRSGSSPALSVIDLNGFGQSTGDPSFDFTYQSFPQGNSNFPNNPNLVFQGPLLRPALSPGTCNVDGGSAGVFTLTRDHHLDDRLLRAPIVESVGEVMIGWPLDVVFSNAKDASGCVAGGGNICAIDGKKVVAVAASGGFTAPFGDPGAGGGPLVNQVRAGGNPISWTPHPNPPGLIFPPLCLQPYIGGQEPTSIHSITPIASGGLGLANLLVPGDAIGNPLGGVPPSGLLSAVQNTWFQGPDLPSQPLAACKTFMQRQQIGHFLYLVDELRSELVVLGSNRMQVLDRIGLPDPTELAMGPDLDFLAVTNRGDDTVSVIDIDPGSASFHDVVASIPVGHGPRGIAWDPGGEDLLVTNELDDSVSVISAFSLEVRKTVTGFLDRPFDVVITPRQEGFGFQRNVYFGWILNRSGELTLFESGPDGLNGWGYDDTIGVAAARFERPRGLQPFAPLTTGAVLVAHETPLDAAGVPTGVGGGAVTRAHIDSAVVGVLPLTPANAGTPQFRDMSLLVTPSVDQSELTGIPLDLAFDDLSNLGSLPNLASSFSAGAPLELNGKGLVRSVVGSGAPIVPVTAPAYVFVAVGQSTEGLGVVDVLDLGASLQRQDVDPYQPGVQSIPAPGVTRVSSYWRQ